MIIETIEHARKHSNHTEVKKYKHVIVATDGGIYVSNDDKQAQQNIDELESPFIVKGGLSKKVKNTKKKSTE